MRSRSQIRSNRLLTGFILVTALAGVVSAILSERDLYRATHNSTEAELTALSRLFVEQADATIDLADTGLLGLRRMLESDPEHGLKLAESLLNDSDLSPNGHHYTVIGPDGRFLAGLGAEALAAHADHDGHEAWLDPVFRRHYLSHDRGLNVGSLQTRPVTGEWSIPFSRRVDDANGDFAGVVVAYVELAHFTNFYARTVGATGSTTAMFSPAGELLALYPNFNARPGTVFRMSGEAGRRIERGENAFVYQFPSPADKELRLGALLKSERHPVMIVSSRKEDDITAIWRATAVPRLILRSAALLALVAAGCVILWQIRRRQLAANALLQKQNEFRVLAEGSGDAVLRLTAQGRIDYASPAAQPILGREPVELIGASFVSLCHDGDAKRFRAAFEATLAGADGRVSVSITAGSSGLRHLTATLRLVHTLQEPSVIAVVRDDTEGYLAHQQLESLATTDPLTGLANRRRFSEALDKEWQRAARDGRPLSLLFVDADRFKAYNDTHGHQAGDRCLKAVADTLTASLRRPSDLAARYGGEEFVLLLPSTDSTGARHLAETIRAGIEARAMPRGRSPGDGVVTVSIGVATERPGVQVRKPEGLVAQADHALYAAKAAGRNRVWVDGEAVEPTDIDWSLGAVDEVEMPPPRRHTG